MFTVYIPTKNKLHWLSKKEFTVFSHSKKKKCMLHSLFGFALATAPNGDVPLHDYLSLRGTWAVDATRLYWPTAGV